MKFKTLWICGKEAEGKTSFESLAYTEEPTHGAIIGLSTPYIEKAAYDKAVKALKEIGSVDSHLSIGEIADSPGECSLMQDAVNVLKELGEV